MPKEKKARGFRWLGVLLIGVLAITGLPGLGPRTAGAFQGQNLLQNPGFEQPYITINGDAGLQVAANWQPWFKTTPGGSSAINARPEYKPAPSTRVRSGAAAQEYNTFFATHTAGVYQRVPVSPNVDLRLQRVCVRLVVGHVHQPRCQRATEHGNHQRRHRSHRRH